MVPYDLPRTAWRKSSYSGGYEGGSNCVEVASPRGQVALRDSKDPSRGTLVLAPADWRAFVSSIKAGKIRSS